MMSHLPSSCRDARSKQADNHSRHTNLHFGGTLATPSCCSTSSNEKAASETICVTPAVAWSGSDGKRTSALFTRPPLCGTVPALSREMVFADRLLPGQKTMVTPHSTLAMLTNALPKRHCTRRPGRVARAVTRLLTERLSSRSPGEQSAVSGPVPSDADEDTQTNPSPALLWAHAAQAGRRSRRLPQGSWC